MLPLLWLMPLHTRQHIHCETHWVFLHNHLEDLSWGHSYKDLGVLKFLTRISCSIFLGRTKKRKECMTNSNNFHWYSSKWKNKGGGIPSLWTNLPPSSAVIVTHSAFLILYVQLHKTETKYLLPGLNECIS
jgi:hypothetical protein